jgi:hypothetical protein
MGGGAFPALHVPRLSHEDYATLRNKCISILQAFYEEVVCPPEAPSKTDHGDVDLIVCKPKTTIDVKEVGKALGASEQTKSCLTTSFAIPLPGTDSAFAQVDVHVCHNTSWEFDHFMASFGDMAQILGTMNRSVGLTMNDKGLNVRISEIEATNRKASMLHLTADPVATMKFLGLDPEKYRQGFASDEEIYAWCAKGRFYGPVEERDHNANDRARLRKRPMFTKCMSEWLPAHPDIWDDHRKWSREEVLQEAVQHFGVQEKYGLMMSAQRKLAKAESIMKAIKESVPEEGERLGQVIRGLKRWTKFEDGEARLLDEDDARDDITGTPDGISEITEHQQPDLIKWVISNHAELRRREKRRTAMMKDRRKAERGSDDRGGS